MAEFQYVARQASGTRVSGQLTAGGERDVLAALEEKGLVPIRIRPASPAVARLPILANRPRKVPGRIMARVYRQMSDLLKSGVPLLKTLELLERQTSVGDLPAAIAAVRKSVADGAGLAESMAKHPQAFGELAVSMIRAGQEGGFLEDVLSRIADYTEQEEELKGRIAGALAYPIFLLVVGTLVITTLVVFFVPKFEQIFTRLRQKGQLPALTEILLGTSGFLQRYGIFLLIGMVGLFVAFDRWRRSRAGRERVDDLKLKLPGMGDMFRDLAVVRFSRVLGTLLANGIPILQALRIAKDSCGNVVLSRAVAAAADNVTGGESLTEPLRQSGYFPKDMIEMVAIAEESNTLERVLLDLADSTEKRTTRQLEMAVKLLEPLMLLVMASVTMVVVAALLLPIMKMSTALK